MSRTLIALLSLALVTGSAYGYISAPTNNLRISQNDPTSSVEEKAETALTVAAVCQSIFEHHQKTIEGTAIEFAALDIIQSISGNDAGAAAANLLAYNRVRDNFTKDLVAGKHPNEAITNAETSCLTALSQLDKRAAEHGIPTYTERSRNVHQ